jgi:glycosyltransferase involved in cell wall biosynthesis
LSDQRSHDWIVFVTDRRLMPPRRGNVVRMLEMMAAVRRGGFRVAAVVPDGAGRAGLEQHVDTIIAVAGPTFGKGRPAAFDASHFRAATREAVRRLQPVGVIVEYAWLAPCLADIGPAVLRIVDSHDLFHERTTRFKRANIDSWVTCTRAEERALLDIADIVLAIQAREAAVFRKLLSHARVIHVGHAVHVRSHAEPSEPAVMFVGFDHAGNLGIRDFLEHVWPAVKAKCPGARLSIYGSVVRQLPDVIDPSVTAVGEVDDLADAYARAAVVICPVRHGSGLKIKLVEALAHGRAVVTTSEGLRGLEDAADVVLVRDEWRGFADAVSQLLDDRQMRTALARRARDFARRFAPEAVYASLLARLREKARERKLRRAQVFPPALYRIARNLPDPGAEAAQLPFVSVVIPVLNDAARLRLGLEALQRQTYPTNRFEVIVVDNGSSEDIRAVTAAFSGVTYACELTPGPAAARNCGVLLSRGEIVAFTDADCLADARWLEIGVRTLQRRAPGGAVAGHVEQFARDPARPTAAELLDQTTYLNQRWGVDERNAAATANLLASTSAFVTVGLFDTSLNPSFEDWDWTTRVFRAGLPLVYSDQVRVRHPSRRTLRELLRKARRIEQGRLIYGRKHNLLAQFMLRRIVHDLRPRRRFLFDAWRCGKRFEHRMKLRRTAIVVFVSYYAVCYRFWLSFLSSSRHLRRSTPKSRLTRPNAVGA